MNGTIALEEHFAVEKEGWLRHQLKLRRHRSAADGREARARQREAKIREARARQREAKIVVSSAKSSGLNNFAELTTPAAPFRNGSILLMARPPLLFKEGNMARFQFIPPFFSPRGSGGIASAG